MRLVNPENEHQDGICQHFQRAADLSASAWSTAHRGRAARGANRFSDSEESHGPISDALLSERLKQLEAEGIIVTRTVTPDTPVRITYGLTERGRDLSSVMEELAGWAERWAAAPA